VRNHAKAMVACDFAVAVTLHFQILYVFVVMEVGSRKLVHVNVTAHPTFVLDHSPRRCPTDHWINQRYAWSLGMASRSS
jgi:hypothetical protein